MASAQDIPSLPRAFLSSNRKEEEEDRKTSTPEPICRFVIRPILEIGKQRGEFASPAYPGFHPPGLQCIYALHGHPNQRVKVDILDLSLPSQLNT